MVYLEFPACCHASDGPFWDNNVTIETYDPDFTVCLQYTLISWFPLFWMVCTLPFYLWYLSFTPMWCGVMDVSRFNFAKTAICCFLAFEAFLELIDGIVQSTLKDVGSWRFLTPTLGVINMLTVAALTNYEFRKSVNSSFVMFVFWLLSLLAAIIKLQSAIRSYASSSERQLSDFFFALQLISFAAILAQFVLTFVPDNWCVPEYWLTERSSKRSKTNESERTPLLSASFELETNRKQKTGLATYCPVVFAPFISRASFVWLTKLCLLGYKRPLIFEDCWKLPQELSNETILPAIETEWAKAVKNAEEKSKKTRDFLGFEFHRFNDESVTTQSHSALRNKQKEYKPSLYMALARLIGLEFFLIGFIRLFSDLISFVQPVLLSGLIDVIEGDDIYEWHGYLLAVGMFFIGILRSLAFNYFHYSVMRCAMKARTALTGMIFRKSLRLSVGGNKESFVGESVNLIAVDVIRIQEAMLMLHLLWSVPMVICVAMAMLWERMGVATVAGIAIMVLLLPFNACLGALIKRLQLEQMKIKDQRIRLLSEVLSGIKVLKMYAWELSFRDQIAQFRNAETKVLLKAAIISAIGSVSLFISPFLVSTFCFTAFVLMTSGTGLTANIVFISLSVINIIYMPVNAVPQVIQQLVQVIVSFKRINEYMSRDEVQEDAVERNSQSQKLTNAISIENADFSWSADEQPTLTGINLQIKRGALIAIVGQVGAGKTSLLHAILGEMKRMSGSVKVDGSIAYIPQQSWIMNSTIKDNIIFGKNFDTRLYDKVVYACALRPDFEVLPSGDRTEVGDKGVNLSGGQRKRITLARAVYLNKDIYVLDDPLSAVDGHVGTHIFDHVIGPGGLLARKTRILVTHNLKILPKADLIVVMDQGQITQVGTYQNLLQQGGYFAQLLQSYLDELDEQSSSELSKDPEMVEIKSTLRKQLATLSGSFNRMSFSASDKNGQGSMLSRSKDTGMSTHSVKSRKETSDTTNIMHLISDETIATGSVKGEVFWTYIKAIGLRFFALLCCSYFCYILASVGSNYWLSLWTADRYIDPQENVTVMPTAVRLGVYVGIGVLQIITVLIMTMVTAIGMCKAALHMHSITLNRIIESPSSFFDTTPVGRVLNRLSKDIDTLDNSLPVSIRQWMMTEALVICTVIAIAIADPILLVLIFFIAIVFYYLQRIYIASARQLKVRSCSMSDLITKNKRLTENNNFVRIDSVLRSPICNHFHTTLLGVTSIRAFSCQHEFTETSDTLVERSQIAYFPQMAAIRWVGVALEIISALLILATGCYGIWQREVLSPSLAALAVTYALQVVNALNLSVRSKCEIENHVVSVERLSEYANLELEQPLEKRLMCLPVTRDWPQNGCIQFARYSARYRHGLDLVLRDVNIRILPREKVGIVGRTGAGKSSLSLAVLRLIEPSSGTIIIDDVDITRVLLHDLRSKINLIPQEPVLFSGSLRMNLDPFGKHSDDELWQTLEAAHLASFVRTLPDGLSYLCSAGGENLSVGQRQLVCLARALLRKTKILVLDEATAAIDFETDQLIQSTIRKLFVDCTILTIAHRLNTIIDYDKILVLESGRAVEFDTPKELASNESSRFHSMARDADVLNQILKH